VRLEPWTARLAGLADHAYDPHEVEALAEARQRLRRELEAIRARPGTATPRADR
jgi:hypothetical protein